MRKGERIGQIARDCVHFRGDRPCVPHLKESFSCRCPVYCPQSAKILIIQLSSAETVTLSGAVVRRLKADDPNSRICYLTCHPQQVPTEADEVWVLDAAQIQRVQMDHFDAVYNLDLDPRACAIMNMVQAETKKGYYLRQGLPSPVDEDGQSSYLRKLMPRSYEPDSDPVRELFQVCGLEYRGEPASERIAGEIKLNAGREKHFQGFSSK